MKLLKCYINNFGKLSDFTFDFNETITVINEENGFGKSTLCAFIKAMFYGFYNTRTKKLSDNERLKFLPWQGGVFGGYLDFSLDEKEYRIERTFKEKQSEDTFSLYNLKTGEKCDDFSENIGEVIFGIDLKGFERCTYYSGGDINAKVPISISSKISSLIDNNDDFCDYDTAIDLLTKRSRQYQTVGNKGIIPHIKDEISELQNQLFEIKKSQQTLELYEIEFDSLNKNKNTYEKELENIRSLIFENSEVSVVKQKIRYYNSLVSKCKDEKEKIEFFENKYGENMPNEVVVDEISKKNERIKFLKEKSFSGIINKVLSIITIVFWILFSVGLIYTITSNLSLDKIEYTNVVFIFAAVAVCIDVYLFVFKFKNNREINKNNAEILKTLAKYGFNNDNFDGVVNELRNDLFAYRTAKNEYQEYFSKAKKYYKDENLKSFKENVKLKTPDELKNKEREVRENIDDISAKIISLSAKINELRDFCEKRLEIQQNIEQKSNKLIECNENYEAILSAIKFLKTAKENLAIKYKDKTQKSFKKYVSMFVDNKIDDTMLSSELAVCVSDKGAMRDVESFSSGTKSVIEFAFRMALIDAVFEKESPFIILDDTFALLDDKTFKKVKQMLEITSEKHQIIYFTCSKSRVI